MWMIKLSIMPYTQDLLEEKHEERVLTQYPLFRLELTKHLSFFNGA